MERSPRIVAATRNAGKLVEMRRLLDGLSIELIGLEEYPDLVLPPETGETYLENARIKAVSTARATGLPAFGDDSGLEVDALGGAPGVLSARFDGEHGTAESRSRKLLALLEGVPDERRTARFRAVVALAEPTASGSIVEHSFEGVFEGRIAHEPSGAGGFGYDPVFLVPQLGLTVASLDSGGKDALSHRGQALGAMRAFLVARGSGGLQP
jgi:XTP/dITP diphosphohydrolase